MSYCGQHGFIAALERGVVDMDEKNWNTKVARELWNTVISHLLRLVALGMYR